MMNLSGLFVGPLLKEFSYRKVAFVGAMMCSLGLMLTSFATSMPHILITYSVLNGKIFNTAIFTYSILRFEYLHQNTYFDRISATYPKLCVP